MRKKFRLPWSAYEVKLELKSQTAMGEELPDATPIAPPIGYVKQPSMVERIREMVRSEQLRLEAEAAGDESFEEADDFNVEDDPEPFSAYEWEPSFEPAEPYTVTPAPAGKPEPKVDQPPESPPVAPPPSGERNAPPMIP